MKKATIHQKSNNLGKSYEIDELIKCGRVLHSRAVFDGVLKIVRTCNILLYKTIHFHDGLKTIDKSGNQISRIASKS